MSVKLDRQRAARYSVISFLLLIFTSQAASAQNVIPATPSDYLSKLRNLRPGDTLLLESGTYDDPSDVPGLPFFDVHGEPDKPIVPGGGPSLIQVLVHYR